MDSVRGHGEDNSRVTDGFFAASDGEMGKEATGWNLASGRGRDCLECGGGKVNQDIHQ